jgi:hypothetical protein
VTKAIILSPTDVISILNGTKTQIRQVLKQTCGHPDYYTHSPQERYPYHYRSSNATWISFRTIEEFAANHCPLGTVGDRLWIRETFQYRHGDPNQVVYRADFIARGDSANDIKWRTPVAMPREASRLTLKIVGVRVERLQNISEADAIAQGCTSDNGAYAKGRFKHHWNATNESHPWDSNPWVWVIEFAIKE